MTSNGSRWPLLARAARGLRSSRVGHAILGPASAKWTDIGDEYVMWLCFANSGMTHRGNLYCMNLAIANLPGDAPIVEIGAFCGLSTNLLAHYCRKHRRGNPLVVCDRWDFENRNGERIGDSDVTHAQYREFVRDSFLRNVRMFSGERLPWPVELASDEFFDAWRSRRTVTDAWGRPVALGGPISFAVIDGNHTYEYARRDFENSDEFLVSGGFLFFDDSADDSPFEGVRRVVQEIRASGRYELAARNPHCLFRKR